MGFFRVSAKCEQRVNIVYVYLEPPKAKKLRRSKS